MRISDWSSDVCSSDLQSFRQRIREGHLDDKEVEIEVADAPSMSFELPGQPGQMSMINLSDMLGKAMGGPPRRSEEHTSELQSLMRISYAVFCLKKKIHT